MMLSAIGLTQTDRGTELRKQAEAALSKGDYDGAIRLASEALRVHEESSGAEAAGMGAC